MEQYSLITTLVAAIVLAFLFGFAASRLRLSPIMGYLLAGFVVGPHSPGFEADVEMALQLSEIGVILLMFGIGLKISIDDIWSMRLTSVPASVAQTLAVGLVGAMTGWALGMPFVEGALLGATISVASTIVFLRAIEDRRMLKSEEARVGISWLLVEDLLIILTIVILPALVAAISGDVAAANPLRLLSAVGITLAKIAAFVALMLVVGARVFPWLIVQVAHAKSRELMSLGTLALALGVAYAAFTWFDASFALGAFLAGLVLNGTKFSHRVAEDSLPLRDTFAVLFFVAVGMLFDPGVILRQPVALAAIVFVTIVAKAVLAYIPLRLTGQSKPVATFVSIAVAQTGEFSFVLAGMGLQLGVMQPETYNLVLASSLISIALNPILLRLAPVPQPPKPAPLPLSS
ncbi:MAG: cation:proton antiporter [Hyphomonadaceae bacterium]|nr:cation:proton antiporter [Hyphomonadaceae bacterium]